MTTFKIMSREILGLALCTVLSALTFFCPGMTKTAFGIERGELPPNFKLSSNRGSEIQLSDYQGKVVLIDFWASWCSSCKASLKIINDLQKKYGPDKFQVLTVNLDENSEAAAEFMKKANMDLLVAYDPSGKTPEAYQIEATPTSVLIGRDGRVEFVHTGGFCDKTAKEFEHKLEALTGA